MSSLSPQVSLNYKHYMHSVLGLFDFDWRKEDPEIRYFFTTNHPIVYLYNKQNLIWNFEAHQEENKKKENYRKFEQTTKRREKKLYEPSTSELLIGFSFWILNPVFFFLAF